MKLKKLILFLSGFLDPPLSNGLMIANRYKVINHLGTGSYGRSYLVFDQQSSRKVVLKALRFHRRLFHSGRQAFEHEKELLKTIVHPGFPSYEQSGTYNNIPFYTMEYIDGKNFEQLIFKEGKRFDELTAFEIVQQLLPLIQHLHSLKIIHRDIRIPNVISNGTNIWLIDLGLAIEESNSSKKHKQEMNSIGKQLSNQADFYDLGHFLLFLLYSNFTFSKGSKAKSWEQELELSPQAKQIIQRLLQIKTPYQSCKQIQKDIEKLVLNGEEANVII